MPRIDSANCAAAVERVLGDRQRHELQLDPHPTGVHEAYAPLAHPPRLRIYVASHQGCHALIDDRDQLSADQRQRLEVIEAEYGTNEPNSLPAPSNPRLHCRSECKGEMLLLLGQDNRQRSPVDYVAFLDDDIEVRSSHLLQATELAARKACPIFQLQLSADSHAIWAQLKQTQRPETPEAAGPPQLWDAISFVEVMAPVIAQPELDAGLLEVMAPFKSGFGWDFYLLPVLQQLFSDFQPGLYRGACMRHQRPVQTAGTTRFSHGLTASQEEELLRAALLQTLLSNPLGLERHAFLQRLKAVLLQLGPVEQALASGLADHTERQWRCRSLEQQHRQLQDQLQQLETAHQQERERLEAALDAVHQSTTWRLGHLLTAPGRLAKRYLRGQRS